MPFWLSMLMLNRSFALVLQSQRSYSFKEYFTHIYFNNFVLIIIMIIIVILCRVFVIDYYSYIMWLRD
jgi:hypothetical protein